MNFWGSGFITIIVYSNMGGNPEPPPSGEFLLETDLTGFLLTDLTNLNLAGAA